MNTLYKQIVMSFSLSILLGCAGSGETTKDSLETGESSRADCISRSSVRGYSVLDESNLIVEGSGRRNYHVALRRPARGLRSTNGIAFDAPTGRICARFADITFKGDMGLESIGIESLRELSTEEHEDLLIRFGKKEPEIKQTPAPREVKGAEVEELDPDAQGD
jgi:hypothetical protein